MLTCTTAGLVFGTSHNLIQLSAMAHVVECKTAASVILQAMILCGCVTLRDMTQEVAGWLAGCAGTAVYSEGIHP